MANKRLSDLDKIQSMQDSDSIVVIVNGTECLITKEKFSKVLSTLTTQQKSVLSTVLLSGDGSRVLTDSGVYKNINNMFVQGQVNFNNDTKLAEINGYHTHSNAQVLDKFSINGDTLLFNGEEIGSYPLPIATENSLGGVKVDGTTITISEDGTISGSSNYELPTATNTVLGGVKVDGDTIKINNGVISADVIGNWASGGSYPVGYFVVHNNTFYQCIEANSDTEWTESKWVLIAGGKSSANITEWESNKEYSVADLIVYENTIYKCIETHTSGTEFDSEKWVGLTGAKGDKGDKGDDGISPTLSYETTDTGVTVTMVDANNTHAFSLSNGINGTNGIDGVDGNDGNDGASAYDIAVSNGFEGTEQEWLETLNGENGVTPHIDSETKHWMIGEADTGVLAEAHIILSNEDGELFVTKTEFNELYDMISSANALLENTLNGGEEANE